MSNLYAKELGVPLPTCCNQGSCCKGASPSTPYKQLWVKAQAGDDFARGFFSIMVPYASHEVAEAIVPGIVQKTLEAARKQEAFQSDQDVVFYQCRYQTEDNRCGVWEDRPQFCRDYPDTPFVVMAPGCAFEPWAKTCKEKFHAFKAQVSRLKGLKAELDQLKSRNGLSETIGDSVPNTPQEEAYSDSYTKIDEWVRDSDNTENLSLVLSLTGLYVASPLRGFYF